MTIQKQPFLLADNLVVVATQMKSASVLPGGNRNPVAPSLFIMFGGTETDQGVQAISPRSMYVYGEKAIEELQAACAFALLPKVVNKLEGT
jgi:hypothetical protein